MKTPKNLSRTGRKTLVATLLASAAFQGMSYADLLKIGVNFAGRSASPQPTGTGAATVGVNEVAGVAGYAQTDWNNLGNNIANEPDGDFSNPNFVNTTSGVLFREDGIADSRAESAVTVTLTTNDAWHSDADVNALTTPNQKIMEGLVKAPTGQTLTLTINNLDPNKSYDFLAYTNVNNANSQGNLTLSGLTTFSTYFVTEDNIFDGTFTLGNATTAATRTPEADYSLWNSVKPDATGKLTLSIQHVTGGDGFGLSAIQIHELLALTDRNRFWNFGAGEGVWDTNVTQNWRATNDAGPSDVTFETDKAFFGDLGTAGERTVTVDAAGVLVTEINVNNSAGNDYTIQGGAISGEGAALTKDGAGALTLTNTNTFSGDATIKHGTVNVSSIGGVGANGNLGRGALLNLGDTTGAADAKLNYTGGTGNWNRGVVIAATGAEIAVTDGGATATLSGVFNGTGPLAKTGPGTLAFTGAGNFSGDITVSGGGLRVNQFASSGAALNVLNGSTFAYTGGNLNDDRNLTIGSGGGTVSVTNANTRYRINNATATDGPLTVTGNGRLLVSGVANFAVSPTIAAGATLALTNEAGTNVLPSTLTVPSGILELAPGSFASGTTMDLTGGTIRLGHEGLQGVYFGGAYNQGDWQTAMAGLPAEVIDTFAALGSPTVSNRTTFGGRTDLSFNNGASNNLAPFADQGLADTDNIRSYFLGKILITNPGDTTFFTRSDDGSSLYIDGIRVVNNNAFQGVAERQGSINLSAGLHDIAITYFEGAGDAGLTVSYTPAGGAKQIIPNSVLFAGDTLNSPATNFNVSENSTLEIAHQQANLGTLTLASTKTLSVNGNATFTSTILSGAAASHGINVTNSLGVAILGDITGTTPTIVKNGPGALLFRGGAVPAGTTIASDGGLVVIQALNDGINPQSDPLAGATVTYGGGGLGFSAEPGTTAPLTFANNVVSAEDYTIGAGPYWSGAAPAVINWNPANGAATVAAGKTAFFNVSSKFYTLNVGVPVSGAGTLNLEQGTINFTDPNGITPSAGVTVQGANATVATVTTGALLLTGNYAGVATGQFNTPGPVGSLNVSGNVTVTSVTNQGGALTIGGTLTNPGAFTQSGGSSTLNGTAGSQSLAVSGGTFTANAALNVTNGVNVTGGTATVNAALTAGAAVTVTGGTANLNGNVIAPSLSLAGSGNLTVRGDLTTTAGTVVENGRTLTLDAGAGNTRTFAGGINVQSQATLHATSGTVDFGSSAIVVQPRSFTAGLWESLVETSTGADDPYVLGQGRTGQPNTGGRKLEFRMGNTFAENNAGGDTWGDNDLWAYTGQFYSEDGTFSFAEHIDDNVRVRIDGVLVLANDGWNVPSNTNSATNNTVAGSQPNLANNYGMGPEGNGWHNIEVKFRNGTGGAGAVNNNDNGALGFNNTRGFVFSPSGNASFDVTAGTTDFIPLVDPGDASVLRTVEGGGFVVVEAGARIAAGGISGAQIFTLNGAAGNPAIFQLHNNAVPTANSIDVARVNGSGSTNTLLVGDNNTVAVGALIVADGANLVVDSAPFATDGGLVRVTGSVPGTPGVQGSAIGSGSIAVQGGTLLINSPVTGSGVVSASISGTIGGTGSIEGALILGVGGTLAPGDAGIGQFTAGLADLSGGTLALEFFDTSSYDRLVIAEGGTLELGGTLSVSFLSGSTAQVNDTFFVISNLGANPVAAGLFNGIADQGTIDLGGGYTALISYDADFETMAFDTGGNDVALQLVTVPEPGAAVALLSGLGMLMGFQRFRRRHS